MKLLEWLIIYYLIIILIKIKDLKNIINMKYEPGEIIKDKYVIIKLIGSGSFGTIYQGIY
jgi:hypothetical protein